MHKRQQYEQSDGRLSRPKDAIRPSGLWILAKLRLRESITTRRRKFISSMYTDKVRTRPPGATGVILERVMRAISEPTQRENNR